MKKHTFVTMINNDNNNLKNGVELPVMEAFFTVQGEGYFAGQPAYFIRIGGCDVGCHWCDVKESWNPDIHPLMSVDKILLDLECFPVKTVVITGGEPLMYNLNKLCKSLKEKNIQIHLETSGAYPLTGVFDWICLSPKRLSPPLNDIKNIANELKVIISNKTDFDWAISQKENINNSCKLYLQPEWSKKDNMLPKIIDFVKINSKWTISIQTQKFMNIP